MSLAGEMTGTPLACVRLETESGDLSHDWRGLTVGDLVTTNSVGGTSAVYALGVKEQHSPPMVAKIFNENTRKIFKTKPEHSARLLFLAVNQRDLAEKLEFCIWPRRLLLLKKAKPGELSQNIIVFGMDRLEKTVSLEELIEDEEIQASFSQRDYVAVACNLADALKRLHAHDYHFVFGDFSARNVHIEKGDQRRIKFIDTDSFQFHPPNLPKPFTTPFVTAGFSSPGARKLVLDKQVLPRSHDEFVLAIHIFILLMGSKGRPANPFDSSDNNDLAHMIETRDFVYSDAATSAVPPVLLETYNSLPKDIRDAFARSFKHSPLTAAQWGALLATYWGSLLRTGSIA